MRGLAKWITYRAPRTPQKCVFRPSCNNISGFCPPETPEKPPCQVRSTYPRDPGTPLPGPKYLPTAGHPKGRASSPGGSPKKGSEPTSGRPKKGSQAPTAGRPEKRVASSPGVSSSDLARGFFRGLWGAESRYIITPKNAFWGPIRDPLRRPSQR